MKVPKVKIEVPDGFYRVKPGTKSRNGDLILTIKTGYYNNYNDLLEFIERPLEGKIMKHEFAIRKKDL